MASVSQLCISFPYVLHGLCEDLLTCDIAFNVVMPLSRASTRGRYSRIEGVTRPSLAKFMAASHYAYNTLKMPGPLRIFTISSDEKDAIICVDKMYRDAVTAEAAPTEESIGKKRGCRDSRKESGKCAPTDYTAPGVF